VCVCVVFLCHVLAEGGRERDRDEWLERKDRDDFDRDREMERDRDSEEGDGDSGRKPDLKASAKVLRSCLYMCSCL
jgi:hypothetical protein